MNPHSVFKLRSEERKGCFQRHHWRPLDWLHRRREHHFLYLFSIAKFNSNVWRKSFSIELVPKLPLILVSFHHSLDCLFPSLCPQSGPHFLGVRIRLLLYKPSPVSNERMSSPKTEYVIGTRKSKLAMVQTHEVKGKLERLYPGVTFKIHEQDTLGDKVLDVALSKIGDKGVFTQELEQGLHTGAIDFAVHSLKDLPTRLPEGMLLGCVMERVDPADVVLIRSDLRANGFTTLQDLNNSTDPKHWLIGTSSLRRQSQLQAKYANLKCIDVRGNLDTRIKKLERHAATIEEVFENAASATPSKVPAPLPADNSVEYAAIILARAGLQRQGDKYVSLITQSLDSETDMFYAVGQGALGIECRDGDVEVLKLLSVLNHDQTESRTKAERSFLRTLEGGCHAPIGVSSTLSTDGSQLTLKGRVLSLDGSVCVQSEISGKTEDFEALGKSLADSVLEKGADKIMASLAKH